MRSAHYHGNVLAGSGFSRNFAALHLACARRTGRRKFELFADDGSCIDLTGLGINQWVARCRIVVGQKNRLDALGSGGEKRAAVGLRERWVVGFGSGGGAYGGEIVSPYPRKEQRQAGALQRDSDARISGETEINGRGTGGQLRRPVRYQVLGRGSSGIRLRHV